jgi:RimJ/RimL family protein N-acetyltransferase
MNIPTTETDRLRLRAFEGGDLEPYAEMYADDVFVRYLGGKTLTKEQAWENIAIILGALVCLDTAFGQLNA